MKTLFTHIFVFVALLLISQNLLSQTNKITVTGKVIENGSQPVMFATVAIWDSNTKTAITGTTTLEDGSFTISTKVTNFYIEISFIGFKTKTITDFTVANDKVNLGTITLEVNSTSLNEFEIQAEKSQVEFKLDKRVFNVGKDLSSTGASATEVLNNVPSVNVNIEGEVSLRGSSGVQILINGKPSIMSDDGSSLGTITADMIEKIEVITNPSAKYDAEGTSGIINIVLKKEEKKGMNGSVSLNVGEPSNNSIGISLNRRTEKFNLFSQIGAGYRSLPKDNENINQNLIANNRVNSFGTEFRNEQFYNLTLGADYHINELNVLTLSGRYAYEIEDQPSNTNFEFYENDILISQWYRDETTEATNPKWQYEMQYQKNFKDNKEHVFLLSALGKFFGKDLSSEFNNVTTFGSGANPNQRTETVFGESNYTFKADYSKPFSKKVSIETGGQYVITDVSNDYSVSNFIGNDWVQDPSFTNLFKYNQKVLGVYGTGAYEKGKWGVKAGLRAENTDLATLLTNTNEQNGQNYTNLFPSLHSSLKVTDKFSLQAGYSKRIYRPRLWDLNPFFNVRNNFSVRAGNPDLQPEFTDSYEVTSIYIRDKMSFNLGVFHRYTTEVIERISSFQNNVNITKPLNIGTNQTTGIEFNAEYTLSKKVSFQGDANYNFFYREGSYQSTSFNFNGEKWGGKLTTKIKLPFKFDFEVTGSYQSGYQTVQSTVSENLFMDIGLRKKIMKGKAVLNLSVRDVFASRFQESVIDQIDNYSYSYGQRGRFIALGFSYGFGKGEAMEYLGGKRR
jgi:outer membrane receptor protein involved in Fe transport